MKPRNLIPLLLLFATVAQVRMDGKKESDDGCADQR